MLKRFSATLLALAISSAHAESFDLTDMMPARPGTQVETTGEVETKENVVVAENEKDGLAVAHQQLIESDVDGVRLIQVGSGNAILAIGSDIYKVYNNINATMLSKRAAYNRAYMKAKKSLVQDLNGLQNSCESAASMVLETIDTGNESLANEGVAQTESCKESVQASLAGWATYDVYDDPESNSVRVTIISSPKTRQAIKGSAGAAYVTTDPNEVFKLAVEDISKGLLPPVGAKVITHAETGEVIVLGYGSSIIRENRNPSVAKKLRQAAERQSQTLSRNAIVGTMQGEKVFWEGGFKDGMVETTEQFEMDPELEDPSKAKALDEDRNMFVSKMQMTDDYKTAAAGKVPPGVKSKTFTSEDGYWAYTVSIYSPSLEATSRQAKRDMESGSSRGQRADATTGRNINSYGGLNDGAANPQGPSGRVGDDADF
jgi:hypothetical protein